MTPRAEVMRRVLGALALLALLGAVLWWTASSKDDAGLLQLASVASAPTATPHAVSTRPPPAPGAAEHPAFRRDPTPLPPAGTPVAAMLPDLKRRADAGDTRAACRLGVELIRCRLALSMMDAIAGQMRDDKAEANGAPLQGEVLESFDRSSTIALQCTGLDPQVIAQAPRWLRQAARAGESDAVILYAEGAGFASMDSFRMLTDPEFDAWRREAPVLVTQALARGSPEAVLLLFAAYSGDQSLFAGLLADDPVQTEAYSALSHLLRGSADIGRLPGLSEAQHQAALQQARRMFRDYFGSRTYADPGRFFRAQRQISPLDAPSTADRAACDPDP